MQFWHSQWPFSSCGPRCNEWPGQAWVLRPWLHLYEGWPFCWQGSSGQWDSNPSFDLVLDLGPSSWSELVSICTIARIQASLSPQVFPIAPIRPCWVVLLPLLCRCQPHLPQHPSNQIHAWSHSRSCFPSCVHVGPLPTHGWCRFSLQSCGQHLGSKGQHPLALHLLTHRSLFFLYSAFPKTPCAQVGHVFPVKLRKSLSWFKIWMSRRPVERKSGIDRPHLSRWPLFFLVGCPCLTNGTLRFFFIEVVFLLQCFFSKASALPRLGAGQGCDFFRLYFMTFFGIAIVDFLAITALSIRNKPVQNSTVSSWTLFWTCSCTHAQTKCGNHKQTLT